MGTYTKTKYPGVVYREVPRIGGPGTEKSYYVIYKKGGKKIEERVGRQYADKMTPAQANNIRADLIEGRRLPRREIAKQKTKTVWTVQNLWKKYKKDKPNLKGWREYKSLYDKWIKPEFKNKKPENIVPLDIQKFKKKMKKAGKSPQRIKHALSLLRRVINHGKKLRLTTGLTFQIEMPEVNNQVTEDLSEDELNRLLKVINEDKHPFAGPIMLMALYSGMRRSELFKLKWEHVDFDNKWIHIIDAKSGRDEKIPLNPAAETVLTDLLQKFGRVDEYIFFGRKGLRRNIDKPVRAIRDKAGLPKTFRPLHGLRHFYLSEAAEAGASLYEIAKLATHKDVRTSQRYIHVRDERLLAASQKVADQIKGKFSSE